MSFPVTIYSDPNFLGKSQGLTAGSYNLGDLLIGNDALSSVQVASGWKLTLYTDSSFSGTAVVYTQTATSLPTFDNKASSAVVEPTSVILYVDANYDGASQALSVGRYDMASLTLGNDKVSSLRIPSGWKVTLYEHSSFGGSTATFTSDTAFVGTFNDMASSIVVEVAKVIVYSDSGFQGLSQTLDVGRYDVKALKIGNDVISSLRVPAGWKVTLYQNSGFSGTSTSYIQDTSALGTFNDQASSIVVEKLTDAFTPVSGQYYTLTAASSGQVADVSGGSTASGASIIQWPLHGGSNQQWSFESAGGGYYYIRARQSGLVAQVSGASTAQGAYIVQSALTQATHQQWLISPLGQGYALVARNSGLVMEVEGASTTSGAKLRQMPQSGATNQIWALAAYESPAATNGTSGTPISSPTVGGAASGASSVGTQSGASTTASSSNLPAQIKSLDEISIQVFFVPYTLPIQFSGAVTIQPLSKAVSYEGAATLTAPFKVSVDPLGVALTSEGDWVVKFGLPTSRSISTIIEDEVLGSIPSSVRSLVNTLVLPYLRIYENSVVILAKSDGEDADYGSYLGGFNVYTNLTASTIPPLDLLHKTFPQIGLDKREVTLGVGATSSGDQKFFVGTELTIDANLGTSAVVLNTIALDVTKETTSTSAGAEIAFTLNLSGEVLKLTGGLNVTTGTSTSVTVWGALLAEDGAWKNPFGVKGLTINSLGVEVGATPTFPYVVLGVRGEVHIGDGLLGGQIGILLDASDASKCILDIYSEEGINLPKLVSAFTGGAINVSSLVDVSLTDLQLYIAPKGGTIAGQSYDPGIAVGGKLDLWGFNASVDGKLDTSTGGYLRGSMDAVRLSAGGVTFLEITSTDGKGDATIDVEFSSSKVGGTINGQVAILGAYKQSTDLTLSSSGFSANLTSSSLGIYSNASLSMLKGVFKLSYSPTIGASVTLEGYKVSVSVSCSISVEVTTSAFSQSISFSFSAMGKSFYAGPYSISVPFSKVDDLTKVFYEKVSSFLTSFLIGPLAEATQAAFNWVKANVTQDTQKVAKFFQDVGASTANIATGLVNFCGTTAEQAVTYLNLSANEAAKVLKETFNKSADEVGDYLTDVAGYSESVAKDAMGYAGYATNEVSDFFGDVADDGGVFNPSNW